MHRQSTRRLSLFASVSLVVAGFWFGTATPAAAYVACPSGWTQVTTSQVGHLTTFCKQNVSGGPGIRYFFMVPKESVGQALTLPGNDPNHPWGSSSNPDPQYTKRSVSSWLPYLRGFWGTGVAMTLNGDFFDSTSGSTSAISYPLFQTGQLVTAAKTPGSDASHRQCLAWGSTVDPWPYTWSYAYSDWTGVQNYGFANCSTASPYHRVVALEPTWFPGGDTTNSLTMVGTAGVQMCFLVGGWQTRAQAAAVFPTFGCTARLQLDGGYSTQLSYYDNGQVDAVTGYLPIWGRTVPHVIVIW